MLYHFLRGEGVSLGLVLSNFWQNIHYCIPLFSATRPVYFPVERSLKKEAGKVTGRTELMINFTRSSLSIVIGDKIMSISIF